MATTDYQFSEGEREFFGKLAQQINAQMLALNNAISLVCTQQKLSGTYRLKSDGSGLEAVAGPSLVATEEAAK